MNQAPVMGVIDQGLGGGVPLSALLAQRAVSCFASGDQGGTYCGNPLACAAGKAVLDTLLAPGFLEASQAVGERLAQGLQALSAALGLGAAVRGHGLLLALELGELPSALVVALARERGLLISGPRPHCLRFMPALNTTAEEIQLGLALLRQVLREVRAEG